MSEHLGFIGVGKMGGPMAGRLMDAGHRLTHLRHQCRGAGAADGAGRRGSGFAARGRLSGGDCVREPADSRHRARDGARRERRDRWHRHQDLRRSLHDGPPRHRRDRRGIAEEGHRHGRLPRERRRRRRAEGNPGGDGGLPAAALRQPGADPQEPRQGLLHRRPAGHGADDEALQQPALRHRHGDLRRGDRHGREGRPRSLR